MASIQLSTACRAEQAVRIDPCKLNDCLSSGVPFAYVLLQQFRGVTTLNDSLSSFTQFWLDLVAPSLYAVVKNIECTVICIKTRLLIVMAFSVKGKTAIVTGAGSGKHRSRLFHMN
jgi:hypothetical protein